MAPEIIEKGMFSVKSDIYSAGIFLSTMLLGFNPVLNGCVFSSTQESSN